MTILGILKKVPIFEYIKYKDLKKIENILKEKYFKKGEHIFSEADEGDEFYIVNSGRIKIYKMSTGGQIKALDYLKSGDFFGEMALLDKNLRSANALATQNSQLFIIRYEDFQKFLLNQPEILITITRTLCQRLRKTDIEIEMFSFKKVRDRLIACLVYLAEKYGEEIKGGVKITREFTQQDLSELVGTAREVVARVLRDLKQESLIKSEKHSIVIPSISKLRKRITE